MSDKVVPEETISKALETLQDLAKGHPVRATEATKVETMRDENLAAGSSAGATQVHHTPSNSDPKGWAGSKASSEPAGDDIEENGTDYRGKAKLMKSILEKLAKGLPLSSDEAAAYASIAKGDFNFGKKDAKDEDKDEDKGADLGKSLADHASEDEDVSKGLELSSFLAGWANVQSQAQKSSEQRLSAAFQKSLADVASEQRDYNAALAKSLASLAEVMTIQAQRIEQLESTPARGPKSQMAVGVVEKSFAGGAPAQGETLTKSQVLSTLEDMAVSGQITATEVVRFESTGQLTPQLEAAVRAHRSGR